MKIGLAITSLHGGGAEFVARRWIDELLVRGHEVHVYVYQPGLTDAETAALVDARAVVHRFAAGSRVARVALLPLWLRRRAREDRLDVMLSMLSFTNLVCLAGWSGGRRSRPTARLVISERNAPTAYLPMRRGRSGRLQVAIAPGWYRRADAMVAISHPVAGDLVGGYGIAEDRCFVVPNPVGDAAPVAAPSPRARTAIAFVGRLVDQKRPELFVDVVAELARRPQLGEVVGVMIGAGPLQERTVAHAASVGAPVELRGWLEPWTDAISADQLDCLVLPSMVEGFGNVCVEAARHHLPSVACSEALGVADAIVPGVTGALAATSRPSDIADAVEHALRLDLAAPRLEHWLARFSVPTSVDALESALLLTCGHEKRRLDAVHRDVPRGR